jgi:predicted Holliday junction resolvase-like endonuclease
MIILLSILLIIAVLFIYYSGKIFDQKIKELDKKHQLQTSAINDLDQAQLRFQQLSNKIDGELEFWKKRRTMLPKVLKNTRKEKIRGKRRKGRK